MTRKKQERTRGSLKARTVLTIALVVLAGFGIQARQEWRAGFQTVRDTELARVEAIVNTLAPCIDGDLLSQALAGNQTLDAFADWSAAPPVLQAQRQLLVAALSSNQIDTPIYVLLPKPGQLEAIGRAPNRVHERAMVFSLTSAEEPYWYHEYEYRPEMAPTLLHGRAGKTGVYEDANGSWVSAYAPILDGKGHVIGILEADAPLEVLLDTFHTVFWWQMLEMLGLGILTGLAVLLILRPMDRAFEQLLGVSRQFTAGDYETEIQPFGASETWEISTAFERSRQRIHSNEVELLERAESERATRAEAQRATRIKEDFLMSMSHEFRTPLNGIIGATETLKENPPGGEPSAAILELEDSTLRLKRLVESTLLMVDIEEGRTTIQPIVFDLESEVMGVVGAHERAARGAAIQFDLQLTGCALACLGDRDKLMIVIDTLLDNAVKFTPGGGSIEVLVQYELSARRLTLRVRDTGPGLSGADLERIYEPFVQLQHSATREFDGAGIGLTIARHYASALGGSLQVESSLGSGSSFQFEVPLEPQTTATESTPTAGLKVLLVEDNAINRRVLGRSITKHGYELLTAEDGLQGVEQWRKHRDTLDVILMDLQMPVMGGLEATRHIRAEEREGALAPIPIMAVTADARPETAAECKNAGMNGYLAKPVKGDQLLANIEALHANHGGQDSLP